jgi:hypothetical protein
MNQSLMQPNPLVSFLPLIIIMIPMIFIVNRLAKEKGKNVVLWTILACIPIVNMIILPYMVGTPSKIQEEKLDRILELLSKQEKE